MTAPIAAMNLDPSLTQFQYVPSSASLLRGHTAQWTFFLVATNCRVVHQGHVPPTSRDELPPKLLALSLLSPIVEQRKSSRRPSALYHHNDEATYRHRRTSFTLHTRCLTNLVKGNYAFCFLDFYSILCDAVVVFYTIYIVL
jgi:hypothetical protein